MEVMDIIALTGVLMVMLIFPISVAIHFRRKFKKLNAQVEACIETTDNLKMAYPTMDVQSRLNFTKDFLEFIDGLVLSELINSKRFDLFLEKPSLDINFDNTMKEMSEEVFNAIKPELFTNPNLIMNKDYILRYITKKVFLIYFQYVENKVAPNIPSI